MPVTLEGALQSLYRSYEKNHTRYEEQLASQGEPPPVLIVVCPNTVVSKLMFDWIAGYEKAGDNRFGSLYSYLANLRDAILPLAIPVSTIGLVVVGGMYMFGSPSAGRILFGVAIGVGMVLLAPSIIA